MASILITYCSNNYNVCYNESVKQCQVEVKCHNGSVCLFVCPQSCLWADSAAKNTDDFKTKHVKTNIG